MANPEIHLNDFMVATGNMNKAVAKAEAYLMQVLKMGTRMKTMDQLRNYKYHHAKRSCLDDLPPTSHAIRLPIRRVYFASHPMVSLLSSCEPFDPKEFCFELIGNNPIPEDLASTALVKNVEPRDVLITPRKIHVVPFALVKVTWKSRCVKICCIEK
ncbi:hypothetical protein SK128_016132, partial [Halocaridina rubra]